MGPEAIVDVSVFAQKFTGFPLVRGHKRVGGFSFWWLSLHKAMLVSCGSQEEACMRSAIWAWPFRPFIRQTRGLDHDTSTRRLLKLSAFQVADIYFKATETQTNHLNAFCVKLLH